MVESKECKIVSLPAGVIVTHKYKAGKGTVMKVLPKGTDEFTYLQKGVSGPKGCQRQPE